jgi:hypothetical protein
VASLQPALKVLYVNRMLDFGMLYFNYDRRLTTTNIIDPFIIAEDSQDLSDRLIYTGGTNFNRMFNLLEVETGLCTSSEPQRRSIISRFFFVRSGPNENRLGGKFDFETKKVGN